MSSEDFEAERRDREDAEFSGLPDDDDIDHDKDIAKEQQARLRRMNQERKRREKQQATIEKVLRGVTTKKKLDKAAETEARRKRADASSTAGVPAGYLRWTSDRDGGFQLALPDDVDVSKVFTTAGTGRVPQDVMGRDPKTGKRIFTAKQPI